MIEHHEWCDANGCRCGNCPCLGSPLCFIDANSDLVWENTWHAFLQDERDRGWQYVNVLCQNLELRLGLINTTLDKD